jgi:hypothetical protein
MEYLDKKKTKNKTKQNKTNSPGGKWSLWSGKRLLLGDFPPH